MVVWKGDGVCSVRVMLKGELCSKVVEIRRAGDRVMAVVLFLKSIC